MSAPVRDLFLPRKAGRRWGALALSILLHALLFLGWITGRPPDAVRRPFLPIALVPPTVDGPRAAEFTYRPAGREPGTQRGHGIPLLTVPKAGPVAVLAPLPAPARLPADTGPAPIQNPIGRIGIGLGDGKLWVRPLPLPPRELAERLSKKTHAELVDSAVTAIVQGYLDSIAKEPANRGAELPSWTTKVAGRTFGLDAKNIYIGGLKIPAAVLALLPLPAGNVDQDRAYRHLQDLRTDLLHAADRAATLEDFKAAIKELRLQKEREREFDRNQRTPPPPPAETEPGTPAPPEPAPAPQP